MKKAVASKSPAVTQPKKNQEPAAIVEWLRAMPQEFTHRGQRVTIQVSLTLDAAAWLAYASGARHRGQSIEETLSDVLVSEDCRFEERGFKTDIEFEDEKENGGAR